MEKKRIPAPASWVGAGVQPRVTLKSLWLMGRQFGCLFEATDVMLDEVAQECPF